MILTATCGLTASVMGWMGGAWTCSVYKLTSVLAQKLPRMGGGGDTKAMIKSIYIENWRLILLCAMPKKSN